MLVPDRPSFMPSPAPPSAKRVAPPASSPSPDVPPFRRLLRTTSREVALTFDDGPDPRYLPRVLDVLRHHAVHATFFMLGEQAAANPGLVEAVAAEGHEVAVHAWSHERLVGQPAASVRRQLHDTARLLRMLCGRLPTKFRPPFGWHDPALLRIAHEHGLETWLWTVDGRDWERPQPEAQRIVDRLLQGLKPGAVMLIHDGRGEREQSVAALPALVEEVRRRGYEFVPLR